MFFRKNSQETPVLELLFHKIAKSDSTSATSNERILQRVTSDFLQRATSATSSEWILQQVTSDFLQRATTATSNERILQGVTSNLQRVTSNEWISTSNEQRVKSYASKQALYFLLFCESPFLNFGTLGQRIL